VSLKPFVTRLKTFNQSAGMVMHALKDSEESFNGFGEAYFSTVETNRTKGWKFHTKMTSNLVVPVGDVRFFLVSPSSFEITPGAKIDAYMNVVIGESNFSRLTIPPGYWVAFQGAGSGSNLILNVADMEHDPSEALNKNLSEITINGYELHE